MKVGLMVLCVMAAPVGAQDWVQVGEGDVAAALADKAVQYSLSRQVFYPSGKTLYDAGRPSWGNWREQNGQYCSEWPPNAIWNCYDLFVSSDGAQVKFVGFGDDVTVGRFEAFK